MVIVFVGHESNVCGAWVKCLWGMGQMIILRTALYMYMYLKYFRNSFKYIDYSKHNVGVSPKGYTLYRYAPHNDVSVNDGPHIRRWFHDAGIKSRRTTLPDEIFSGDFAASTVHFVNIYAKTNKYSNYSFSLLFVYGSCYMFWHYIAILRERS
jgi:hypothetical protein